MNTTRTFLAAVLAGVAVAASAATTITIDSVIQRWPWNNKVDITYTIGGGQDLAGGSYQKIVFTTVIDGVTYTIDGVKDVGASANAGTVASPMCSDAVSRKGSPPPPSLPRSVLRAV